jgi:hypothetical protein
VYDLPASPKRSEKQAEARAEPEQFVGLWPALPETPELQLELELEDEIVAGGNVEATYLLWERRRRLDREQEGLRWSV